MTIEAKLAHGEILTFPDGTDPGVIQRVVMSRSFGGADFGGPMPERMPRSTPITRQTLDQQGYNPTQNMGPIDAFKSKYAEGFRTIGRGMGLPGEGYQEPDVVQQYDSQAIAEKFPKSSMAGEVLGEATPFAVAGGPIGAVPSTAARVGLSGILGGIEGWMVSRGHGANTGQAAKTSAVTAAAAGAFELVLPIVGRRISALYRRIRGRPPSGSLLTPNGIPTPELQDFLDDTGLNMDDLTGEAMDYLQSQPSGTNPAQAVRRAQFDDAGVTATRGDITQNFSQQAEEARLIGMGTADAGQPLRTVRLNQSEQFTAGVSDLVDSLGVSGDVGENLKRALTGRLDDLKGQKNKLYRSIAEVSPEVARMPLFTDSISEAMPSPAELRRASRMQGNDIVALRELMVEFGVDQSDEAVEAFTKSGGELIPLNIGNFEEFRQALNGLGDNMSSGGKRTSHFVGQIKSALDGEIDLVDQALSSANITDTSIVDNLKEARSIVRQIKTEYSPQSIAGRLTGVKRDGITPVVEASKVYDSVMGNKPVEFLQRTVDSLMNAGPSGRAAVGDLQAAAIMDAMDKALKAPSRKTDGIQLFNYSAFYKELNNLGDEKLNVLFKSNPDALKRLKLFQEVGRNIIPDASAMPKGSGHTILDALNVAGNWPGIAAAKKAVQFVVSAGKNERGVRNALKSNPEIRHSLSFLQSEYPSLASAIGIAGWLSLNQGDEN